MRSAMTWLRALAAVALAAVVWSPAPAPADDAEPYETFHLDRAPVTESSRKVIMHITTGCQDPITWSFATGEPVPDEAYRVEYDAQGTAATPGSDYRAASGQFVVSRSQPFDLVIDLVDDQEPEGPEHVTVVFRTKPIVGSFAGNVHRCTNSDSDPGWQHFATAFTITDTDVDPALLGGAEAPSAPAASSKLGSAGATPRGPSPGAAPPSTAPQAGDPEAAASVRLGHRPGSDTEGGSQRAGLALGVGLGSAGAAAGAGLWWLRSRRTVGPGSR